MEAPTLVPPNGGFLVRTESIDGTVIPVYNKNETEFILKGAAEAVSENARYCAAGRGIAATGSNALNGAGGVSKAVQEQILAIDGRWATSPSGNPPDRQHVR